MRRFIRVTITGQYQIEAKEKETDSDILQREDKCTLYELIEKLENDAFFIHCNIDID